MAIPHVVVLTGALTALLCLPCAVALLLRADEKALRRIWPRRERGGNAGSKGRQAYQPDGRYTGPVHHRDAGLMNGRAARPVDRRETRQLRRVDRQLTGRNRPQLPAPGPPPCIEQIAAELQRLDRQRRSGPTTESTVWLAAVLRAYDEWLRVACRSLGVVEHLQPLEGLDREAERLRLEMELQANGVPVRRSL